MSKNEVVTVDHPNMVLWNHVETTNPKFTKDFSRGGGFKGTAVNPVYLVKRATELWGPMGHYWDFQVVREEILEGAPFMEMVEGNPTKVGNERIHVLHCRLRYPVDNNPREGEVYQYGQTTLVGRNKYGYFTDEEAPKKSYTDALTKCLSYLGFSADVHMGMWDDHKYVAHAAKMFSEQEKAAETQKKEDAKSEEEKAADTYFDGLKAAGWEKIEDWWSDAVKKSKMNAVEYARVGWKHAKKAKQAKAEAFIVKWIKENKDNVEKDQDPKRPAG